MCKYKVADIKCIAPFPALIGVSKPPGGTDRWSDIGHVDEWQKGQEFDKGFSLRVMFSTRQNLDRLINGEKVFKSAMDTEIILMISGLLLVTPSYLTWVRRTSHLQRTRFLTTGHTCEWSILHRCRKIVAEKALPASKFTQTQQGF